MVNRHHLDECFVLVWSVLLTYTSECPPEGVGEKADQKTAEGSAQAGTAERLFTRPDQICPVCAK